MVATPEELKSVFSGASLRRDAELGGRPAALYLGQIKNYAGQPVAVLEVIKDTTEYEAAAASSQRNLILGTIAILAGAVLLAFLLGRGLSRPLTAITAVMNRLSGGDTEVAIPGGDRKDELGTMAVAVDVFRRSMMEAGAMRTAQEAAKQQAEAEKKALQRQMADRFEADVKSVVSSVAKATKDMQRVAGEITASVNGTSERATAAAAASEEARPASTPSPPPPRNWRLPWPRSAARSRIPAASPTTPWSRPDRPPKWSGASRPPAKRSATCFA